jgi:hypothetical protein
MTEIHYVYELVRISPGHGATRYIGVRTATNGDPQTDDYWSSSEKIAQQRAAGAKFERRILKTFSSREEAELYEAELHWQNMVGKNPHFYNVTSQLIEGKVDQFLPRERYRSPDGGRLWFKPGSEPDGWVHDPARWAQYRDLSHRDSLRQQAGFPQTYEGLELPEWEFHKYYPDEMAFSASQPRHCYEPYVKLNYRNDALDCAYFPQGCQPSGWFRGFASAFSVSGEPPRGWLLMFHVNPASQQVNSTYFPREAAPKGWVDLETYEQMAKDRRIGWNDMSDAAKELRYLCDISKGESDLKARLRSYRVVKREFIGSPEWESWLIESGLSLSEIEIVREVIGRDKFSRALHRAFDSSRCDDPSTQEIVMRQNLFGFFLDYGSELTADEWADTIARLDVPDVDRAYARQIVLSQLGLPELPEPRGISEAGGQQSHNEQALNGHISDMIEEATRLHQEAMQTIATANSDPLSQLKRAQKLLQDCEILASDAASYSDNTDMQQGLASLHRQQGQIELMISQLEQNTTPRESVRFSLVILLLLVTAVFVVMIAAQ